jgi:hypothetical protein
MYANASSDAALLRLSDRAPEGAWFSGWEAAPLEAGTPLEDYTDMGFNPDEPGWGVSIMQSAGNRVFAAWYTYDANNQPTWIVLPEGTGRTAVVLEGALYRAAGSAFRPTLRSREVFGHADRHRAHRVRAQQLGDGHVHGRREDGGEDDQPAADLGFKGRCFPRSRARSCR